MVSHPHSRNYKTKLAPKPEPSPPTMGRTDWMSNSSSIMSSDYVRQSEIALKDDEKAIKTRLRMLKRGETPPEHNYAVEVDWRSRKRTVPWR